VKKRPGRREKLDAVGRESDRNLRDLIRRWQALPPYRRTNFLRRKLGSGRSAL
jgi:hypothetical protein